MTTLEGKTALVTGSTSGIGLGIARGLAEAGAGIVMNGFGDADDIEKERLGIEQLGVRCVYDGADMTKPDEIVRMVHDATEAFGSVDIVVNNAGIQNVQPVDRIPEMHELNIGHSIVSRAVMVGMERAVREMKSLLSNGERGTSVP